MTFSALRGRLTAANKIKVDRLTSHVHFRRHAALSLMSWVSQSLSQGQEDKRETIASQDKREKIRDTSMKKEKNKRSVPRKTAGVLLSCVDLLINLNSVQNEL